MADLGVSSLQLDEAERGFSFLRDGPLDMRMGTIEGLPPASRLVNTASFEELKRIFGRLGEEPMGGRIARTIVDARAQKPIESTAELAGLVEKAYGKARAAKARLHPATRTFMALRMAVNHELEELEIFLERILDRLRPGGRLVVISFHSLEDRMVKHTLRREASDCLCPPRQPLCTCGHRARVRVLTKKPVMAGEEEVEANPRSRGAKLRAAERLPQSGSEEGGR
jgi:16S rRNA (cytosine1402-N4)-methyltransferase